MSVFSGKAVREDGQTAILTTMFFTILMTVITVGAMNLVSTAQAQNANTELVSAARAAAESGVEDAKRFLAYCAASPDPTVAPTCKKIYTAHTGFGCNDIMSFFGNASYPKLAVAGSKYNGEIKVGVSGKYTEYYTCLQISAATDDYVGSLDAGGKSMIVPLTNMVNDAGNPATPAYVAVQWHDTSTGANGDGQVVSLLSGSDLPNVSNYNSTGNRPAVLRVQLANISGNMSPDQMANASRAVTLRPSSAPSPSGGSTSAEIKNQVGDSAAQSYGFSSWKQENDPNAGSVPLFQRKCTTGAGLAGYSCYMVFSGLPSGQKFLRLQTYYRSTHFRVTAYDGSGNQLYFYGTQPTVDVTGRAADSFQRIRARLDIWDSSTSGGDANSWYPDYAIDSGGPVCKNIDVYANSGTMNPCP